MNRTFYKTPDRDQKSRLDRAAANSVGPRLGHTGPGAPLPRHTQRSMEQRFGTDFSGVRVHTGSEAAGMARDIDAQAFTHGSDIYFNRGRFDPESISGRHLLAHELTHTIQQAGRNDIQRMEIGTGAVPHGNADWQEVPDDHKPRAEAAIEIMEEVAENPRLINYFRDTAPGGTNTTLEEVVDRARVWELINEGSLGEAYEGESDVAYDPYVYRIGRYLMASTLLHELGHLASFATEEECENTPEMSRVYTPFIERITPRSAAPGSRVTIRGMNFGFSQTEVDKVYFNGTDAGRASRWEWDHADQSTVAIRVPEGATSGPVWVENNRVRSNELGITVTGT